MIPTAPVLLSTVEPSQGADPENTVSLLFITVETCTHHKAKFLKIKTKKRVGPELAQSTAGWVYRQHRSLSSLNVPTHTKDSVQDQLGSKLASNSFCSASWEIKDRNLPNISHCRMTRSRFRRPALQQSGSSSSRSSSERDLP